MNWKFISINCLILISCSAETEIDSPNLEEDTSTVAEIITAHEFNLCDIQYDTITNEKYSMHVGIFDKFYKPETRGYSFKANGDTSNFFLYHQDIAAFVQRLNPLEDSAYSIITNKAIYLIVEYEPYSLDYGLTQWPASEEQLDYFFYHVEHPICNEKSIDSIIVSIKTHFREPHNRAIEMKNRLLNHLELAKENLY